MLEKSKKFFLDLLFPKFCLGCQKEGEYLCQDCQAVLEILSSHRTFQTKYLSDLYFATDYQNLLLRKLIQKFKYPPFIKELAQPLASLIINHFQLIDDPPVFLKEKKDFVLVPIPLAKKRLKWRGFNQAEEIAKQLTGMLSLPMINNVLIKTKLTSPQIELSEEERKENVKGVFLSQNQDLIKDKKVLLIDDIYTTGATMEEGARILREAGAKEIIGIVIAKATPGKDRFQAI